MATPINEQIAVKLKTRLGLISSDNSYETTISEVVRPTQRGNFHPQDWQLFVTQEGEEPNAEMSHPGNPPAQAWDLVFSVIGMIRQGKDETTANDTHKNQFKADVIKAVTVPQASWHNWDGLAINTTFGSVEPYRADDGSGSGFQMAVNVLYRVSENDPYEVRA